MTTYWYECDNCEDREQMNEITREGWHCGCGGHMYLVKKDRYAKTLTATHCDSCDNKGTMYCEDCSWR